ncbi:rhomboid 2 [Fusarium albosuccineum]|uniref:Rhomboid 2 n=1 Tax=Fusarium albosuccineum TaxID=1237068 RepID=A0A8H4L8K9_9HYPO|nr:rhomboid 2 [Fusarium albosuccineum]
MRPRLQTFNALRARSYVTRLPLFTRLILLVIVALWIASVQSVWDLREWGALIPDQISILNGKLLNDPLGFLVLR